MELEVQVFEAEMSRSRQIWRENALKAKLSEAEEIERRAETEGKSTCSFWGRNCGRLRSPGRIMTWRYAIWRPR